MPKYKLDKFFEDSFKNHSEDTKLSDWESFMAFKEENDLKIEPKSSYWRKEKMLFLLLLLSILGVVLWYTTGKSSFEKTTVDSQIASAQSNTSNLANKNPTVYTDGKKASIKQSDKASNLSILSSEEIVANKRTLNIDNSHLSKLEGERSYSPTKDVKVPKTSNAIKVEENRKTLIKKVPTAKKDNKILRDEYLKDIDEKLVESREIIQAYSRTKREENYVALNSIDIISLAPLRILEEGFSASNYFSKKVQNKKTKYSHFRLGTSFQLYPYATQGSKLLSGGLYIEYENSLNNNWSIAFQTGYYYRF